MTMTKPITIIAGAQWGSEGKGAVAGALAVLRDFKYAVRTGAINAGHTVYYKGRPYAMQQIPVAWVNPNTRLVIGPGAYVHYPTIQREINTIEGLGVPVCSRLYVDERACVHLDEYSYESKQADRHAKIGATGKGCAEAVIHKIKDRGDRPLLLRDMFPGDVPWKWVDAPAMLTWAYEQGHSIMLEGTQGELLDFHLGPWPYVTSRQTTPAAWVAEAGLSPSLDYDIVLVARTYPIRVAGNSGPMYREITWPILARRIAEKLDDRGIKDHPLRVSDGALIAFENAVEQVGDGLGVGLALRNHQMQSAEWRVMYRNLLSEYVGAAEKMLHPSVMSELRKLFEFTTVTKKLRRVAELDRDGLSATIRRLRPSLMVMTFMDYEFPELHRNSTVTPPYVKRMGEFIEEGVDAVTVGPYPENFIVL